MAEQLPRLNSGVPLVRPQDGTPHPVFHGWWQKIVEAIEALVANSDYTVVTKIASYTETTTSGELLIKADLATGFTITLPTAVGNTAKLYIKKMQGAGSIIVDANAAETIDGGLTATLTTQYQVLTLVSDNSNWIII